MTPVDLVLEPLAYDFMQRGLATAVVAAVVCALLSSWLVLVGWSLMGDAVSHSVLPGVVLAHVVGAPFALGALVFGFLAVGLVGVLRGRSRVRDDAVIGIVFTTLFALGLVLVSVTPSQTDLNHIVFGNLLGVSTADLVQVALLATPVVAILLARRRDLTLFAFDPAHAQAIGLSPRRLSALLLVLLAVTVVVALQVVGVVLVVALLIVPGATARLLTDRFARMLVIAPAISIACAVVGVIASYWLDASPGGLVVLVHGIVFAIAFLASRARTRVTERGGSSPRQPRETHTASVATAPSDAAGARPARTPIAPE